MEYKFLSFFSEYFVQNFSKADPGATASPKYATALDGLFFVVDAFIVIVLLLLLVVPGTAGSDTIVTATVATYIRTVVNEFAEATNTADGIKK